jgi:tetratricopeptide (TPR) repeat protein
LLKHPPVDTASVMRAAMELYRARQYPGAAVVCADALDHDPDNLHLRLLRARSLLALRNDMEAQDELAECVRRDAGCVAALRLLGELCIRRDQPESAAVFLHEALRLDPGDAEAEEWLHLALNMTHRTRQVAATARPPLRSATAAEKLPAAAAVAGHSVQLPVASGFGAYLRDIGVLTEPQLRAALAYKRATGVRLGRAVTTLGFASELKIEWASLAYHGRHRRSAA